LAAGGGALEQGAGRSERPVGSPFAGSGGSASSRGSRDSRGDSKKPSGNPFTSNPFATADANKGGWSSESAADVEAMQLRRAREASEKTWQYNRMLGVCAAAQDFQGAERIMQRMIKDRIKPNNETFAWVISASAEARDIVRAEFWLNRVAATRLYPKVPQQGAVLRSLAEAGAIGLVQGASVGDSAARTLTGSSGFFLHIKSLSASSREPSPKDVGKALEFFHEMVRQGKTPDLHHYTMLLGVLATGGRWEEVRKQMKDMREKGLEPNEVTYCALISGSAYGKDVKLAEEFFSEAVASGLQPTLGMMNAVLKVAARSVDVPAAERWLMKIKDAGMAPDTISHNTFLDACARAGDIASAEVALQRMTRQKLEPDAMSYNALVRACSGANNAQQAESWLDRMMEAMQPDTRVFNAALKACVDAKDFVRLGKLYERMREEGVAQDAATFTTMALLYARRGDFDRVEDLMFEAREAGFPRLEREYSCLLSAYANARPREPKRAERVFRDMVTEGVAPNDRTSRFLGMALGRNGARDLMVELGIPEPQESQPPDK
ncbi:unnamed protein product, partial [Polarella glacialis]